MGIDINSNYTSVTAGYTAAKTESKTETAAAAENAVAEAVKKEDGFVKSEPTKPVTYKPDMKKVESMKAELKGNMSAFRQMVQGLFNTQGNYSVDATGGLKALFENLTVDEETKLAAQQAISEDGEWGVEATANRILDFAKAISGGDPEKIELLRKAVEDGFKAAEDLWGGKLPEISYKTRERVMEGFDAWAKEAAGGTEAVPTEE